MCRRRRPWPGSHAQLLAENAANATVCLERVGLPAQPVQGQQLVLPRLLPERIIRQVLFDQMQGGDGTAPGELGLSQGLHRIGTLFLEPSGPGSAPVGPGQLDECRTPSPQGQRGRQAVGCLIDQVLGEIVPGAAHELDEPARIDFIGCGRQQITPARRGEPTTRRAERTPQS